MSPLRPVELVRRHPVAALVAGALVLRLATLTWGIGLGPYAGWYHPDESKAWRSVVGFPGNYPSNPNLLYGTAVQYTIGIILLPLKILWHSGYLSIPSLTYDQLAVLVIRTIHAMLGAATVALTYRLALRLWDETTALLAAALLAVSFYHTLNSALTTLDVPMSFLATLGLVLTARAQSFRISDFVYLGVVLGYLAGTKITGAALVVAPLVMTLTAQRGERARWMAGTAVTIGVAALVFALSTPQVLLHPRAFVALMREQHHLWIERYKHTPAAVTAAWLRGMARALTPPVAGLALAGLVVGRATQPARRLEWAVLAYIATNVLIWRARLPARFLLPLAPIFCAYAARSLVLLSSMQGHFARRAVAALTAVVLLTGLAAVTGGIWTRWTDVRTALARAITRIVPASATIGFATASEAERWTEHAWRYPKVDTVRYRLVPARDGPDYLVVTDWTLRPMRKALESGQLDSQYRWPDSLAGFWYRYRIPTPEDFRFYAALLGHRSAYEVIDRREPPTPLPVEFGEDGVTLYRRFSR